jgi:hypothetical protein
MNKIIYITLFSILTSCFYRDFHQPKHKKGLRQAHRESIKYKNHKSPYKKATITS